MTAPIEPGTYRLTKDIDATYPDKRKRHDWRARPVRAGTLIVIERLVYPESAQAVVRAYPLGEYSHRGVSSKEAPELFAALDPVPILETPSQWLEREHRGERTAPAVLDVLAKRRRHHARSGEACCRHVLRRRRARRQELRGCQMTSTEDIDEDSEEVELSRLDELVHEEKAEEAAIINNDGIDAQVEYLLGVDGGLPYDGAVEAEAQYLRAQFAKDPEVLEAIARAITKAKER